MSVFCCCCKRRPRQHSTEEAFPSPPSSPVLATPKPVKLPDIPVGDPITFTPVKTPAAAASKTSLPATASIAGAPVEPAEVGEIVSDGSDLAASPDNTNKSHVALDFVKNRFRKHLSADSSTNHSANCSSNNDENVARRAEVRRLMHQRIQQELQQEDASVTDSNDRQSTKRHSLPYNGGTPCCGPRDQVEFSVEQITVSPLSVDVKASAGNVPTPQEVSGLTEEPPQTTEEHPDDCRRLSCPDCFRDERRPSYAPPARHVVMKDRGSMPEMRPSSGQITTDPKDGTEADQTATGRLSPGGDNSHGATPVIPEDSAEEVQPKPGVDRRPITPNWDVNRVPKARSFLSSLTGSPERQERLQLGSVARDESPMRTWLWSQGLYSPARSPPRSFNTDESQDGDCTIHQAQAIKLAKPPTSINDLDGATGLRTPLQDPVRLQDMGISHQLDPNNDTTQLSPRRSLEEHLRVRDLSNITLASQISELSLPPNAILVGNEDIEHGPTSPFPGLENRSSSIYSPAKHSDRGSMIDPGLSLTNLLAGRKGGRTPQTGKSTPGDKRVVSSGQSSYKTAPRVVSGLGAGLPSFYKPRDSGSQQASETSSFLRREAELSSIDKRFADSHLRRGPSTPVLSKFVEGFEDSDACSSHNRSSILSRLHLTIPKRVRLSSKAHETDDLPNKSTASAPSSRLSSIKVTPKASVLFMQNLSLTTPKLERGESSASEMWKKAFKPDTPSQTVDVGDNTSDSHTGKPTASLPKRKQQRAVSHSIPSRAGAHNPKPGTSSLSAAAPQARLMKRDDAISRSLVRSSEILEEWTRQLKDQEDEAKLRSTSGDPGQLHRTQSTTSRCGLSSKEPAGPARVHAESPTQGPSQPAISTDEEVIWSAADAKGGQDHEPARKSRVLSNRFGEAVRNRMSKLIRGRHGNSDDDEDHYKSDSHNATQLADTDGWEPVPIPGIGSSKGKQVATPDLADAGPATGSSDYDHGTSNMGSRTTELFSPRDVGSSPVTPTTSEGQQPEVKHTEGSSSPAAYATPASRLSLYNNTQNLRSKFLDDMTDGGSVDSVRSDAQKSTEKLTSDDDTKFKTWNGRSKSHPRRRRVVLHVDPDHERAEIQHNRATSLATLTAGGSKEV